MATDTTLESSVAEVRAALDELPHGLAKKLAGPIDALISEAHWLNIQRDRAREELAELSPTGTGAGE